jgi:hypothetical protein
MERRQNRDKKTPSGYQRGQDNDACGILPRQCAPTSAQCEKSAPVDDCDSNSKAACSDMRTADHRKIRDCIDISRPATTGLYYAATGA